MNLDPAVMSVPFAANIDIRDTVDYKEVMGQYQLGPNGAIMTSLNLFATRFDQVRPSPNASEVLHVLASSPGQTNGALYTANALISQQVLDILEKRAAELDYILVDTPGTHHAHSALQVLPYKLRN